MLDEAPEIILVHGSWHGAWCWSKLLLELALRNRRAIAFDLAGSGEDYTPIAEVTLDRWAEQIAELLRSRDRKVILVGHSLGGVAISAAAERMPGQVAALVYLCAFLPRDGESVMDLSGQYDFSPAALRQIIAPDATSSVVSPESVVPAFYADCSAADIEFARARLRAQSLAPATTPIRLTAASFGMIPRFYIECTLDRAIPLDAQQAMVAASPCAGVFRLDASHSPFFSMPDQLADVIASIPPVQA